MTERASELGGTLSIDEAVGGGTQVIAVLPFRERLRADDGDST